MGDLLVQSLQRRRFSEVRSYQQPAPLIVGGWDDDSWFWG